MILTSDLTLEAVLGGAVSANQPEFHVDYIVRDNSANPVVKPATRRGALDSTTDVTLISPSTGRYSTQGFVAEVLAASIYNKDTASVAVTVKTTDGSTDRIICKATLATTETLIYTKEGQWYVMTADGAFKNDSISYAESTFTPGLTFGGGSTGMTFSAQYGKATKIGNLVFLSGRIVLTAKGSSTGDAVITNLPYTTSSDTNYRAVPEIFAFNLATSGSGVLSGQVVAGATSIYLAINSTTGGNGANADEGDFNNNSVIHFSITYQV